MTSYATKGGTRWRLEVRVPVDPARPEDGDRNLSRGGLASYEEAEAELLLLRADVVRGVAQPIGRDTFAGYAQRQEIRILDPHGNVVSQGENGEITVRGANVMRGYLGRPEDTAATVVDGWLHTGDVGHLDEDGYLTLVGRSKEMIIRGGENIYPKEIEDVLTSHPDVLEAAVIGVPDEKWGEIVVAFVQARSGVDLDVGALTQLCQRDLTASNGPRRPTSWRLSRRTLWESSTRRPCVSHQ